MRNFIVLCLLACLASCTDKKEFQTIRERIDLSGNWNSSLGNCTLPGTTDENKLGDGRHPTNVTSQLTRTYPYSGIVEYEKDVEIPVQMEGKRLILFMERTKPSTLWIDGDSIGTLGHIYAPHCYSLPALAPGSHHIKIRIDNSPAPYQPKSKARMPGPTAHKPTGTAFWAISTSKRPHTPISSRYKSTHL